MATPGEFTSRAFLGGKLDLSQAEAVADLIASGSRAAHTLATDQMRGGYSAELETLRGELLRLASLLELELDFGEVIPTRWKDCAKSCWNSLRSSNWNSTFRRKRSNSPTARNSALQWSGSVRRSTG